MFAVEVRREKRVDNGAAGGVAQDVYVRCESPLPPILRAFPEYAVAWVEGRSFRRVVVTRR